MDGIRMSTLWHDVCGVDEIWPNTGVCARIDNRQIAIFRIDRADGATEIFAIDNHDPHSGANVLSRGIVGNLGARTVVASPIYKQHFDLATGDCLEEPSLPVRSYAAEINDGRVRVCV
ncbi:nitrite reductase small subunit NirD [Sinimarinibacterium sp. CAU 1509]|nr:nitrite reductase small subunit NirD [Sinimarinibacterium sp. CAU 1509]